MEESRGDSRMSRAPRGNLPYLGIAVLAFGTASCGDDPDQVAYCVDQSNQVVDADYCDDDGDGHGGFFFINTGSHLGGLGRGARLNGGNVIPYTDTAARERAGLPARGSITGGKGGFGTTVKGGGRGFGSFGGSHGSSGS